MIFQAWVTRHCGGKPARAAALIEQATGEVIPYGRIYRWFTRPMAMSPRHAALIERASAGACTLPELLDASHIAEAFSYANPGAEAARVRHLLTGKRAELQDAEARLSALTRATELARAEVSRLQARLGKLQRRRRASARAA